MKQMPPNMSEALKITFSKSHWDSLVTGGRKKPRMKKRMPLAKKKKPLVKVKKRSETLDIICFFQGCDYCVLFTVPRPRNPRLLLATLRQVFGFRVHLVSVR